MAERFQLTIIFVEDEPDAPLVRLDHTIGTLFVNLDTYYELPQQMRMMSVGQQVDIHLLRCNVKALGEAQNILERIGRNIEAACKEQGVTFKRLSASELAEREQQDEEKGNDQG